MNVVELSIDWYIFSISLLASYKLTGQSVIRTFDKNMFIRRFSFDATMLQMHLYHTMTVKEHN